MLNTSRAKGNESKKCVYKPKRFNVFKIFMGGGCTLDPSSWLQQLLPKQRILLVRCAFFLFHLKKKFFQTAA